jgi:hypothetical protein
VGVGREGRAWKQLVVTDVLQLQPSSGKEDDDDSCPPPPPGLEGTEEELSATKHNIIINV